MRLFLMGSNTWRAYREWPPETTHARELFFRAGGGLSFEPPGTEAPDVYRYDPLHPTAQPWDFGEPDLPTLQSWPLDPDPGPDRVLYRWEPLERPLTGGSRHWSGAAAHVWVRAPGAVPRELHAP